MISLLPSYSTELLAAGRDVLLAGDDEHREVGVALGHRPVQLLPGPVLGERAVLVLDNDPSLAGPFGGADLDDRVALLRAAGPLFVADVHGHVAARRGDPLDRAVDAILEGPPLAGAGGLCLGDSLVGTGAFLQLDDLPAQLGDHLAVLLALLQLALVERLVHADHRLLVVEERVDLVFDLEQLQQRIALLLEGLLDQRLNLLLNRAIAVAVEALRNAVGERLVGRLDRLRQPLAEHRGVALEFAAHVVDVCRGALGVQHPRADLNRLRDRLGRGSAGLRALANDLRGPLVFNGQALDHDAVVERAHGALDDRQRRSLSWGLSDASIWTDEGSRTSGTGS